MLDLTIRPFDSGDREACLSIFHSNDGFFDSSELADYSAFLDNLPGPYYVVEVTDDGVIACGGIALENESSAVMCWGMVREAFHGQSYGRRLLLYRIDRAKELPGVTDIVVNTSQLTVGFFEKLGFHSEGEDPDYWGSGLHRIRMRMSV